MFVVNVQVALRCKDELLVIGRSKDETHAGGALDIPGGKVDTVQLGPAVLEAVARREVLEETGVSITVGLRYVCSASFRTQDGHPVINVVFAPTTTDAPPAIPQASEVSFAKWLPFTEVLRHPDLPAWTAAYIRQAFPEIRAE
jgi:8-oxo-dGTP pyrophosphatase MutT (NUDIX family)